MSALEQQSPERRAKPLRHTWRDYATLHSIIPLLLFFAFTVFILLEVVHPWLRDHTAFLTAPRGIVEQNPVQTKTTAPPFAFTGHYGAFYARQHSYLITPLWDYQVTARVLHFREYYSNKNAAEIVPFDLALGWGPMSDPYALQHYFIFSHSNLWGRMLWVSLRGNWQDIPPNYIAEAQSGIHYSNNHLVPANDAIYATIKSMQAGDVVTLKGKLIDITQPMSGWSWKTTRYNRDDPVKDISGGDIAAKWTTCDTMYVESATIDHASSISYLFQ